MNFDVSPNMNGISLKKKLHQNNNVDSLVINMYQNG